MVYLDTSVALAHLLGESRRPADSLWRARLTSSRLLEYELWVRLNSLKSEPGAFDELGYGLLRRVDLVALAPQVLARATEPFPVPVRTLDALHLATMDFLRAQGQRLSLVTYDERLAKAAERLGFPVRDPETN